MTPERWQKVKAVLEDALERATAERAAFLDFHCQGDDELRREVESLLASEDQVRDFIEIPVFRIRTDDVPPLATGQLIGPYRIVREIGRGGMGAVYLAERADQDFTRRVALKLIRRGMDSEEIVQRFRSERQILARLDHDNIAKLLDGGTTEDGRLYFVMEYVEGQPLDEYCAARALTLRQRLELFREVCSAVHFAHQNLVVHRDLKPGNILVTAGGTPKLLDFGIAKLLNPDQEPFALTRAELRPMTPEYASPEQVRGQAISTASDVYSLGVLLYGLLTGRSPYRPKTDDPRSLEQAILEDDPPRPSSALGRPKRPRKAEVSATEPARTRNYDDRALRRQLAGDLDNIVLKAMSKEPHRRYASVDQLANDIERHLKGLPVIARKDTLRYRAAKFVGRHKLWVSVAAAVLALIVGFAVTVTVLLDRAVRERERAEGEQARAEEIARFLENLFAAPDPSQARGESITVKEILDQSAQSIDESLPGQPALRADLMEMMGRVYRNLGLYESARELLQESLDLRRRVSENPDQRTAYNLINLANVLRELGRDSEAEPLIREGLGILRRLGETRSLAYAKGLTNLGALLLESKGRPREAEILYQESLAIKRRLPEADEKDIATSLNNLGKIRYTLGDYAACEALYGEALAIRRRLAKGRPDPDVATSLSNLATLHEERGEPAKAEPLFQEAIAMRRKLYGDRHPKLARSLNNFGIFLLSRDKAAEAEQHLQEAVSIADEALQDHVDRAIFLRNLASAQLALGRSAEAEGNVRKALAAFRTKMPDSWRVADAESVLGACLAAQGRYNEAEPLLTGSYPRLAKDEGEGAKRAEEARARIVELYTSWGKPEKAAAYRAGG